MDDVSSGSISAEPFGVLFESLCNWGRWPDDERGALNLITPECLRRAVGTVKLGRSISLSLVLSTQAGPDNPKPAQHFITGLHRDDAVAGGVGIAADYLGAEIHGEAHTHVDALCHVSYEGRIFNGADAGCVKARGADHGSIDAGARDGIVGRGVLLDVPRWRSVSWLEPGESVGREELEAVERSQGVALEPGDVALVRTGHDRRRRELGPWDAGSRRAGLALSAMTLLHQRDVAALGSDGDGDTLPSPIAGIPCPVHVLGIVAMGLHFFDNMDLEAVAEECAALRRWEFLLVASPLRVARGTGALVNPLAVL